MHIFILKQGKLQDKPQGKGCFAISPRHMPGRGSDSLPLQFQTKTTRWVVFCLELVMGVGLILLFSI